MEDKEVKDYHPMESKILYVLRCILEVYMETNIILFLKDLEEVEKTTLFSVKIAHFFFYFKDKFIFKLD